MHGMVEQTFEDGRRYSGMFSRDYYHGLGTYTWPDDYTFSTLLKDHDIKFVELVGSFRKGNVVNGELKFKIGKVNSSIKFENIDHDITIGLSGLVVDWLVNAPKVTRKCEFCQQFLYTSTIKISTGQHVTCTKQELQKERIWCYDKVLKRLPMTYPVSSLPVQRLPQH